MVALCLLAVLGLAGASPEPTTTTPEHKHLQLIPIKTKSDFRAGMQAAPKFRINMRRMVHHRVEARSSVAQLAHPNDQLTLPNGIVSYIAAAILFGSTQIIFKCGRQRGQWAMMSVASDCSTPNDDAPKPRRKASGKSRQTTSTPYPTVPPENFEKVWGAIYELRRKGGAPVDTMGCERLFDPNASPEVKRYQILVSLMLSSQTRDEIVAKVIGRLQRYGLTAQRMLDIPETELAALLTGVSYSFRKAQFIKRTTSILVEEFNGDVPSELEEVLALPGVGPKMAHLFLQTAWGRVEGIGVDTHVHRISARLGWTDVTQCKTPEKTQLALQAWLPKDYWRPINALLVGFGQTVCRPVSPLCPQCPASPWCPSALLRTEPK